MRNFFFYGSVALVILSAEGRTLQFNDRGQAAESNHLWSVAENWTLAASEEGESNETIPQNGDHLIINMPGWSLNSGHSLSNDLVGLELAGLAVTNADSTAAHRLVGACVSVTGRIDMVALDGATDFYWGLPLAGPGSFHTSMTKTTKATTLFLSGDNRAFTGSFFFNNYRDQGGVKILSRWAIGLTNLVTVESGQFFFGCGGSFSNTFYYPYQNNSSTVRFTTQNGAVTNWGSLLYDNNLYIEGNQTFFGGIRRVDNKSGGNTAVNMMCVGGVYDNPIEAGNGRFVEQGNQNTIAKPENFKLGVKIYATGSVTHGNMLCLSSNLFEDVKGGLETYGDSWRRTDKFTYTLDLNGYDQIIQKRLSCLTAYTNYTSEYVSSRLPATFRVNQSERFVTNNAHFNQGVSYCLNASGVSYTNVLNAVTNRTAGSLTVNQGSLILSERGCWPELSKVSVSNGLFVTMTAEINPDVILEVNKTAGGRISVETSSTLSVWDVLVDGRSVPPGLYATAADPADGIRAADWMVNGSGVICVLHPPKGTLIQVR